MRRRTIQSMVLLMMLWISIIGKGQQSSNTVSYKVTYDASTQVYTTWVIPNYNVPNANNSGTTEKGATAQFTLVVPKDFLISNISDIRGVWEKTPSKLGPGQVGQDWSAYSLDPLYNYYVIGKSPTETDYGTFQSGQAVSLFTFKGNACYGPVSALAANSPFIAAADAKYSLGVANSFYSRSGQPAGGNQNPLEQFKDVVGGAAACSALILANADNASTPSGTPITTNVLNNDTVNGNPASISTVNLSVSQQPSNGTVLVNADGTLKYTPNAGFSGTDCYVYQICDKTLTTSCDTAKVCVTVSCPNLAAPTGAMASPDSICAGNSASLSATCTSGTLNWFSDAALSSTVSSPVSPTTTKTYYGACVSGTCKSPATTVTVTVTACSTVIANADNASTPSGTPITTNVLNNDTVNGSPASISTVNLSVSQQPSNGTVLANADGTLKYTPNAGFSGTDCYVYQICDKTLTTSCDTAKVCVSVVAPQRIIYAFDDNNIIKEGQIASGNLLANDVLATGTAPLVANTSPVQQPAHGTVSISPSGVYQYTPVSGYTGTDIFKYQVCDSGTPVVCDIATVNINIEPANKSSNNAPVALSDNAVTNKDTPVSGNVMTNDKDPDAGQTLTASVVSNPTHGTLVLNPNGSYTYTPNAGFTGSDIFTYKVCDNGNPVLCDEAVVNITVKAADGSSLPPVANDDLFFRDPASGVSGNVLANDSDPNGGTLTVSTTPISNPSNGNVVLNANGTFTYTPNAGYTGIDMFTYQVCNNQNPKQCSQATVYILAGNAATGNTDIRVSKTANKSAAQLNELISYTIVVKNLGPDPATNIIVKDSLSTGLVYQSASANKGTFVNPQWNIPLLASGDSAVLTLTAKVVAEGVSTNFAKVLGQDQTDPNAQNNEASACSSVPMNICRGDKLQLSVPSTYTNVKWYKDGVMVASGNVYLATESGTYTMSASNGSCPSNGCCPFVVVVSECCPVNVCIPVTITKIIR